MSVDEKSTLPQAKIVRSNRDCIGRKTEERGIFVGCRAHLRSFFVLLRPMEISAEKRPVSEVF